MSCNECTGILKQLNKKPDCKACGKVKILKSNYEVFTLVQKYPSLIKSVDGGFDIQGIKYVFELENIPLRKHKDYVMKIMTYFNQYFNTKHEIRPK